ncbi:MAG: PLP-dependent aminotransferase family protein [Anaerolineaceae bacterium]|nr:PLP-dependent aminotransferase family protein [Anaerolineaceae bacterium]
MLPLLSLLQELRRDGIHPIFRQLAEQLRELIANGQLPPGTRLPGSRELAKHLQISRLSVVHAYELLQNLGMLHSQVGKGTFVSAMQEVPEESRGVLTPASFSERQRLPIPHSSLHEMVDICPPQNQLISFLSGSLPYDFFPLQSVREAIDAVLDRDGAQALRYEPSTGYLPLRRSICEHVCSNGIRCQPDEVLITGGAQQSIDLILQALTQPGDAIVSANPTFLGLLDSLCARRLQVLGLPLDDDGMELTKLEEALQKPDRQAPALIFAAPCFHNPTGVEMSLPRRRHLLRLASQYQIPILEDGVFHEFRYEGTPLPPLKALDEEGIVIYSSTFSKNLLPGINTSYIIAPAGQHERFQIIHHAAEVATASLNQRVVQWLLEQGIVANQLGCNLRVMQRRRDAALYAAEHFFPREWRWRRPLGGFFLWVELPAVGPNASELYRQALEHGVSFAIGDYFFARCSDQRHLRLNFTEQEPKRICEGFQRLVRAWKTLVPCEKPLPVHP